MNTMLNCRVCGENFAFTEAERALYAELGFEQTPCRCPACRMAERALNAVEKPKREMFVATCEQCGEQTEVPFRPTGDKPVYCLACFKARKQREKAE